MHATYGHIGPAWIAPGRLSAWILVPRGEDGPVQAEAQVAQGRRITCDLRIFCAHACWREVGGSLPGQFPRVGFAYVSAYVLHSPRVSGSCIGPAQVEDQVDPSRPSADDLCISHARVC